MRSTIIGGAGFIGSHLAEYLLDAGDTVTVLDDFSSGRPHNLKDCRGNPAFTLHEGRIGDGTAVRRAIDGSDRVFHFAVTGGPDPITDRQAGSSHARSRGARAVFDACLQANAELLIASAGEDALARAYWCTFGLGVSAVRLFTTVGARQSRRYGGIVPELVGQALRNDPLLVPGDGRRTHCFSYVGDIVPALTRIIAEPDCRGLVIDLGGTHAVSDLELAQRTIQLLGSRSSIRLVPRDVLRHSASEDARRSVPDCTLARRLGRFAPTSSLDTIILKVAKDILSASSNGVHAEGVPLSETASRK